MWGDSQSPSSCNSAAAAYRRTCVCVAQHGPPHLNLHPPPEGHAAYNDVRHSTQHLRRGRAARARMPAVCQGGACRRPGLLRQAAQLHTRARLAPATTFHCMGGKRPSPAAAPPAEPAHACGTAQQSAPGGALRCRAAPATWGGTAGRASAGGAGPRRGQPTGVIVHTVADCAQQDPRTQSTQSMFARHASMTRMAAGCAQTPQRAAPACVCPLLPACPRNLRHPPRAFPPTRRAPDGQRLDVPGDELSFVVAVTQHVHLLASGGSSGQRG